MTKSLFPLEMRVSLLLLVLAVARPTDRALAQTDHIRYISSPHEVAFPSPKPIGDSDSFLEHRIAVSSRHYIGLELGMTHAWLGGSNSFFSPYTSSGALAPDGTAMNFHGLGYGEGVLFGATGDYSLSDHFGLQGKIQYFSAVTKGSEVDAATSPIAPITKNYRTSETFLDVNAMMRYQLVFEEYYMVGGVSVGVPISENFKASSTSTSQSTGTSQSVSLNPKNSDAFFNNYLVDLRVGAGTFMPISDNVVLTPEIILNIPMNSFEGSTFQPVYKNVGVNSPRLWRVTASVGVKFPNGGFSLYDIEHERDRKYEQVMKTIVKPVDPTVKDASDVVRDSIVEAAQEAYKMKTERLAVKIETPEIKTTSEASVADYAIDPLGRLEDCNTPITGEERQPLVLLFNFAKSEISPSDHEKLDCIASLMLRHTSMRLEIDGYTDDKGALAINLKISQARAEAVKQYIVDRGVQTDRLIAKGFGPKGMKPGPHTEEDCAMNRKAQFIVLKPVE